MLPAVGPLWRSPRVALLAPGGDDRTRALRVRELDTGRVVRVTRLPPSGAFALAGGALVTARPEDDATRLQAVPPRGGDRTPRLRVEDGLHLSSVSLPGWTCATAGCRRTTTRATTGAASAGCPLLDTSDSDGIRGRAAITTRPPEIER